MKKLYIYIILIPLAAFLLLVGIAEATSGMNAKVGIYGWDDQNGYWSRLKMDNGYGLKVRSITTRYAHHEIHEGDSYCSAQNATLASGSAITFLLNTPAGASTRGHLLFNIRASGEARLEIYEGGTVSALGSDVQETNHNRNSSNVSSIKVTLNPTVTSLGTELEGFEKHVGAGQTQGGTDFAVAELVMADGLFYIINAVCESAGNDVTVSLDLYESDDAF